MSSTNHRRDPFLPLGHVGGRGCKRPESPPLGIAKRRSDGRGIGMRLRRFAISLFNPRLPQLVRQSPLAIAARRKRPRLAQRIGLIVDITELGKAV